MDLRLCSQKRKKYVYKTQCVLTLVLSDNNNFEIIVILHFYWIVIILGLVKLVTIFPGFNCYDF